MTEPPLDEFVDSGARKLYREGLRRGLELAKEHVAREQQRKWTEMSEPFEPIDWTEVEKAIERE